MLLVRAFLMAPSPLLCHILIEERERREICLTELNSSHGTTTGFPLCLSQTNGLFVPVHQSSSVPDTAFSVPLCIAAEPTLHCFLLWDSMDYVIHMQQAHYSPVLHFRGKIVYSVQLLLKTITLSNYLSQEISWWLLFVL